MANLLHEIDDQLASYTNSTAIGRSRFVVSYKYRQHITLLSEKLNVIPKSFMKV